MTYCEKDRAFGDLHLASDLTKLHIFQAGMHVGASYGVKNLRIDTLGEKRDMENGLDCYAYVREKKSGNKLPVLQGAIQFRVQRPGQHQYLNVTISDCYQNGYNAELWKSLATVGVFATCNNVDNPDMGFSYFAVYDMAAVMKRLKQCLSAYSEYPRYHNSEALIFHRKFNKTKQEWFFTIRLAELARIDALEYIGIDEVGEDDSKKKQLLGEFHGYTEIANALQSQGFWKKTF
jgi:hypothetical protein